MKTVLVTGGLGFIGKNFIETLLISSTEYNVINVDAGTYAADRKFDDMAHDLWPDRYMSFISHMQYTKIQNIIRNWKVNYVVNFAAESHVDNSIADPTTFFNNNVMATQSLVEDIRQSTIDGFPIEKFIHISTDEVYGDLPLEGKEKFLETTPYNPSSPYAASKAASDHIVSSYRRTYNLPFYITHCSNNYGPGQFDEKLIPKTIKTLNMMEKAKIYGTGENMRDWIHVDDHNRGIILLMELPTSKLDGEYVFNFGGGNCVTNIEMVKIIHGAILNLLYDCRLGDIIEFVEDRKGHDLRYEVSYKQSTRILGWIPSMSLSEGIKQTVEHVLGEPV